MKYMGSKNRIASEILPIMLAGRKPSQFWVEPFVGGANLIDKVDGKRLGFDANPYLIEALKLIRDDPFSIPDIITEEQYAQLRNDKNLDGITGFVGFSMSFGGKWFGGYRRDRAGQHGCAKNAETQSRRAKSSAIRQSKLIQGVGFICSDYRDVIVPEKSIIYCDPPYAGTTGYTTGSFDHHIFWEWCRCMAVYGGHVVFISEYSAPGDFVCVWEKKVSNTVSANAAAKTGAEKLFTYVP